MRIISNFHDYYDSLQRIDEDRTIYQRNMKIDYVPENEFNVGYIGDICKKVIGYCGQIIKLSLTKYQVKDRASSSGFKTYTKYAYSLNEAMEHYESYLASKGNKYYFYELKRYKEWWAKEFAPIFEWKAPLYYFTGESKLQHTGVRKSVAGMVRYYEVIENPCLKTIEFFRHKDTATAYQDINSYVTGVLGKPNPVIPEIDDKTMAQIKGFDKYSFRKDKK